MICYSSLRNADRFPGNYLLARQPVIKTSSSLDLPVPLKQVTQRAGGVQGAVMAEPLGPHSYFSPRTDLFISASSLFKIVAVTYYFQWLII